MALIEQFIEGRSLPQIYRAYLSRLFETWSDALIEAQPPRGRALDMACGTGIVTRKIAAHPAAASVVGIDIGPPMVEAARDASQNDARIEFAVASADAIDQKSGSFQSGYCQ